jgi:transcription elongation factor GreA
MAMVNNNLNDFEILEEKLLYLKERQLRLTTQLEQTRQSASSDSGLIDEHQLIEQLRLLEKHIEKTERSIRMQNNNRDKHNQNGRINVGDTVTIKNKQTKLNFTLVEQVYSQSGNQISVNSPIGKAVLGKRVGDRVKVTTPKREIFYKINSIK